MVNQEQRDSGIIKYHSQLNVAEKFVWVEKALTRKYFL